MTANFLWGSIGSVVNLITNAGGQFTSLANGTLSSAGSAVNNSGNFQSVRLSLTLGSAAFVAPSYMSIYAVTSQDGTNGTFPTLTSAAAAALSNYLIAVIYINGSTAAQNENLDNCFFPYGYAKYYGLTGGSTPTLAASGNALDAYPTPTQY